MGATLAQFEAECSTKGHSFDRVTDKGGVETARQAESVVRDDRWL
jgi:hypothetical protein